MFNLIPDKYKAIAFLLIGLLTVRKVCHFARPCMEFWEATNAAAHAEDIKAETIDSFRRGKLSDEDLERYYRAEKESREQQLKAHKAGLDIAIQARMLELQVAAKSVE